MGCVKVLAVVLRVRMKVLRTQSDKEDGRTAHSMGEWAALYLEIAFASVAVC